MMKTNYLHHETWPCLQYLKLTCASNVESCWSFFFPSWVVEGWLTTSIHKKLLVVCHGFFNFVRSITKLQALMGNSSSCLFYKNINIISRIGCYYFKFKACEVYMRIDAVTLGDQLQSGPSCLAWVDVNYAVNVMSRLANHWGKGQ